MNYTNKPSRFNNRSMALMGIPDLPEAAFGGDIPPMHRKALVRAMGIRPQGGGGGGGGGLMAVVGIAAAIAIPFAAPAIAASLGASMGITAASFGMSAAVGGALGSALVGAGLGAVTSAAMGQNVGRGALFGGIGGGVGGYLEAANAANAANAASGFGGQTTQAGMLAAQEAGMGVAAAAPGTGAVTTGGLSTGFGDATSQAGMLAAQEAGLGLPQTQQAAMLAAQDAGFGAQLSNVGSTATAYQAPTAGLNTAMAPATPVMYPSSQPGGTPVAAAPAGTAAAPTTSASFSDTLSKTGTEIQRKFTDPRNLADMTLRAAGMLAGSAIAGDGLSDQERALLDAQTAELQTLQTQNQALFNEKLDAARNLIGESKYFDPEYFGLQSARRAQTQVATAKRAGLSGLTGERRQAEERRYDIAGGRATGTAYDTGFQTGVQGRLATEQAGLSAFPSQYPSGAMTGYGTLSASYGAADRRRRQAAEDVGSLFGGITGVSRSRSLG